MFADSFSALMALIILNFAGMLVMFLFLLRSMDAVQRGIHDLRAQMQLRMTDCEHQIAELNFTLRKREGGQLPENDPLPPLLRNDDDLREMLETSAARLQKSRGSSLDIHTD